ncbi:MAG TPA: hypothetical protein PLN93_11340 [Vicinamibacterales bacterium]|nr:hypothetical protein [Vicinamibacterales bacterium]HOQ60141.1 hypothetical protein [Vicinamibacterales bacterium]HPK72523.1 hypothetical protein [Vicinamibacterales bacterium]
MTRADRLGAGGLLLALAWLAANPGPVLLAAPVKGLTHAPLLSRAFDLVYDADFAGAERALAAACGPAPPQACDVVRAAGAWWRLYLDFDDRSRDAALLTEVAGVIARGEAWVRREPERAEAWLYLGAAYGVRVQYHGQRLEVLAAARDGKRIKNALERALALDPDLHDAHAGIGLYRYYAGMAPSIFKILRWFLGLPGGNREAGIAQLRRAREHGVLMRSEAAYQIYFADIWYENKPDEALELLAELRARHPGNPMFLLNTAQVHEIYRQDIPAALAAYRALVDGARRGSLHEAVLAETWGHLGAASQLQALAEQDRAIEEARAVVALRPERPYGAVALAHLEAARAADALGRREEAVASYRAAQEAAPLGDPRLVRRAAQRGLQRAPDAGTAEAARRSLDGWRAFERGAFEEALAELDRAVAARGQDGVHRYRRARVLAATGDRARAREDFQRALDSRPPPPPPFVAASYAGLGALAEAASDPARAAAMYGAALRVRGAFPDTQDQARRALQRIRSPR